MGSTLSLFSQSASNPNTLERSPNSQAAKEEMEHMYKRYKAMECKERISPNPKEWEQWFKLMAVSECNVKLLEFANNCAWVGIVDWDEIKKRKLEAWRCFRVFYAFNKCLKKLEKKYEDYPTLMDIPITDFNEES